jgi:flagellar hook-basal body complex protein FliE
VVAPLAAAKAYAQVQASAASITAQAGPANAAKAPDPHGFGEILKTAMSDAMQAGHNAETQMILQAKGKADLVDVATAIQSAQASLQTVMAVRDQVIAAYNQIMAMPL